MVIFRDSPAALLDVARLDSRMSAIEPDPQIRFAALAVRDAVSATLGLDADLRRRVEARHLRGGALRYRFADDDRVAVSLDGPGPGERIAITTLPAAELIGAIPG